MGRQYAVVRSVSMYPDQWAHVDDYGRDLGKGMSAVMRLIVDDWTAIKKDGPGSIRAILAGYLAGQVTAEEAITALTVHSELMPAR